MLAKQRVRTLTKRLLVLIAVVLAGTALFFASIAWLGATAWDADIFLDAMEAEQDDWVADVGSGEGKYSLAMAEAVGDAGRVFAVDIDAGALKKLNDTVQEQNVENVTSVLSVYDNPMLPRRSVDALLIRNTYHEFTAHAPMLRHMQKALRPDGRLVLAEFINDDLVDTDRATQVDEHKLAMRYARDELRDAGFTIVEDTQNVHEERSGGYWFHPFVIGYRLSMWTTDTRMWMIVAVPDSHDP